MAEVVLEHELSDRKSGEAVRAHIQELVQRFEVDPKTLSDWLLESDTVRADLMSGRRRFQRRHVVRLIAQLRRFRSNPVDARTGKPKIAPERFRAWCRADEFALLWVFVFGRPHAEEAGIEDMHFVRREFLMGGHRQEAVIYDFVPECYERPMLHCSLDPSPLKIPDDPRHRAEFEKLERKSAEDIDASPLMWRGAGYTLSYIQYSRTDGEEIPTLTMRFKKSDYVRRLTTRRLFSSLAPAEREAILDTVPDGVREEYCGGFGVVLAIITADHKLLFFKRSKDVAGDVGAYDCTVTEGMDGLKDFDAHGQPSVMKNAIRALVQEAALRGHEDDIQHLIRFHGVVCRSRYYEWALYGSLDLSGTRYTAQNIIQAALDRLREREKGRDIRVKHSASNLGTAFIFARDSFEFQRYVAVNFTLADVARFITTETMADYAFTSAVMTLRTVLNVSAAAIAHELMQYRPGEPAKA